MSESLTPHNERECQVPLVSLVNEAYGEILDYNEKDSFSLGSMIADLAITYALIDKAEEDGTSLDDSTLEKILSNKSARNDIKADIQILRHRTTLADVGVRFAKGGISLKMIDKNDIGDSSSDHAAGADKLLPVVNCDSERDVNRFVKFIEQLNLNGDTKEVPENCLQLISDVLGTTGSVIWNGCRDFYSDEFSYAEKKEICGTIGQEIEKFIQIDQAVVDNINLAELLPKQLEEFKKAALERSGDSQKYFAEDWLEIYRLEDAVETYQRLEKYFTHYAQDTLPEYIFLGDADREGLKDWSYIDGGIAEVVARNTDKVIRVIEANRSSEAVDYALRYASNFRGGMESALKDLLERPEEDRPVCQLPGDEDLRTYDSVLKKCIDRLNNMENDLKFSDIVADFDQQ